MPANGEPLSILQICSASQSIYGAVQSLLTLADAQRRAGKRVEFITFAGKEFGPDVRRLGYPVYEVAVRAKVDPLAVLAMRRQIVRGRYDAVHTHLSTSSVNGCLAARLAKVPCVATVHGLSGKLSFAFADHLIAVSNEVKNHLVRQGVPAERITPVHNGLPMDVPIPGRLFARRSLGLPDDAFVAGTVSRIVARKGIGDAIEAIASLDSNVRYLAVGDGETERFRHMAADMGVGDRVTFAGYRQDIDECLAAMDLFLFPSHKEAMGIALVEAMRAGLPSVAYDTGGIPEVLTAECGVLVPPDDIAGLTRELRRLAVDRELRTRMGAAARARAVAEFSDTVMEQRTEAVYRRLIA